MEQFPIPVSLREVMSGPNPKQGCESSVGGKLLFTFCIPRSIQGDPASLASQEHQVEPPAALVGQLSVF